MAWKLFLDDERSPPDDTFEVARSYSDVQTLVEELGMPSYVSFDHDLGEEKTGYDVAKWLVYSLMTTHSSSLMFSYYVHSQNPVGKANIEKYLESYCRHERNSKCT